MDDILLDGVNDYCTDEGHVWCADNICACNGAVCTICLAVRDTDGKSE